MARALRAALVDITGDGSPTRRLTAGRFTDDSWSVSWPDEQRYAGPSADDAFYDVLRSLDDVGARRLAADGGVGLHGGSIEIDGHGVARRSQRVGQIDTDRAARARRSRIRRRRDRGRDSGPAPALVPPSDRAPARRRDTAGPLPSDGPYGRSYPLQASRHGRCAEPVALDLIGFVDRSPAGRGAATEVTAAEALQRLRNQTLATHDLEREVFHPLERLVRAVPAVVVTYAAVDDGTEVVVRTVGGPVSR